MTTGENIPIGPVPSAGRVFCNRTLNLRSIRAVGYDMDYTLVQYRVEEWEVRAYEFARQKLLEQGWPVAELRFDPDLVIRGLIIDTELGNIVKANRFGYVKRVFHGTRPLSFEMQRRQYSRTIISLGKARYVFLNSLFSLSEACIYAQLVDLLDSGEIARRAGLCRPVPSGSDADQRGARRRSNQRGNRRGPRALHQARPRDRADASGSEALGEEAAAHHQRRMDLHKGRDGVRVRPVSAHGHGLAQPVRPGDRGRAQARTSSTSARRCSRS